LRRGGSNGDFGAAPGAGEPDFTQRGSTAPFPSKVKIISLKILNWTHDTVTVPTSIRRQGVAVVPIDKNDQGERAQLETRNRWQVHHLLPSAAGRQSNPKRERPHQLNWWHFYLLGIYKMTTQSVTRPVSEIDAKNITVLPAQRSNSSPVTESGLPATQVSDNTNPIITVVRDTSNPLGKQFNLNPGGAVSKDASVNLSCGMAVMHRIETHDELASLLINVGNDPHAAIVNTAFDGIEVGEEFVILSAREIEKQFGIPRSDRDGQKGVHEIMLDGKPYKATGRFKENVTPSCWQIIDRDIDRHTPGEFAKMSDTDWLSAMDKIMPGLEMASYVRAASTSSRVLQDGQPVGAGNGHLWVKVTNPLDIERVRTASIVQAARLDMTWQKPRHSRAEPEKVVGKNLTTIFDPSVWTPGRLIFIGKPVASDGLTVTPLSAVVHQGENDTLDTAAIVLPDAPTVRQITRKAGSEMDVQTSGKGLRITAQDLTLETEIDTEDHGQMTARQIIVDGLTGKIRCQTPFRDSNSFAAFMSFGANGEPFIHDVGTGITHWLNKFEAEKLPQVKASCVHELENGDFGAALEPEATVTANCTPPTSPHDDVEHSKQMDCIPAVMDVPVKAASKDDDESSDLPFPEVELFPTPVDPASLLNEITATILRFIVMSREQAYAAALWVALTWFIDVVEVAPLAIINAPEKACGKSLLLELMGRMSARPLPVSNATTAALFRSVELWAPTMLMDEADTFVRENKEFMGIVNAGHTRGNAFVLRVVGDNHEPKKFTVWGAKALAGIALEKHLPDSTMSRGIAFNIRRKLPHESVTRLRHAEAGLFEDKASKLARFADDYSEQVRLARPDLPDALNDRAQDNWEPLLAIAECAGPDWVRRATAAALKLSAANDERVSTSNELLADIQHVFESKQVGKMKTADLIDALVDDEEKSWATYNRDRPISPRQLAKQLSGYT
jgi:hypothetical protein